MLGTSIPSTNTELPIPVPKAVKHTVPDRPTPAPWVISAIPAASASLMIVTGAPMRSLIVWAMSTPAHESSRWATHLTVPPTMGAGKAHPTGPVHPNDVTNSATTSATSLGVPGFGVGIRCRFSSNSPVSVSTGAAFMPLPPMSMPNALLMALLVPPVEGTSAPPRQGSSAPLARSWNECKRW